MEGEASDAVEGSVSVRSYLASVPNGPVSAELVVVDHEAPSMVETLRRLRFGPPLPVDQEEPQPPRDVRIFDAKGRTVVRRPS